MIVRFPTNFDNRKINQNFLVSILILAESILRFSGMKILIEISCGDYDSLVSRVSEESAAYSVLKNGVRIRSTESGRPPETIMIVCEEEEAASLLQLSKQLCPRRQLKSKSQSNFLGLWDGPSLATA